MLFDTLESMAGGTAAGMMVVSTWETTGELKPAADY
jgi:hypothetical protein